MSKLNRLIFGVTLFIALIGGNYMLYHLILPARVAFHLVATIGLLACLYVVGLPHHPFTLGALAMLAAVVIAIPSAMDPRMALENGWSAFINLLLLLTLVQLCRAGYEQTLYRAHFAAGAIVAIVAIAEFLIRLTRPYGFFFNISLTGAYAAALLIPSIHTARECRNGLRVAYWYLSAILAVTVVISGERGALLSAGVAGLVYLSLTTEWRAWVKTLMAAGAGLLLITVLILMTLQPGHGDGDVERWDLWRASMSLIESRPLGVGPGLFAQAYRQIGTTGQNRYGDAHNQILTIGAELGGPGLAAAAVMLGVFFFCAVNHTLTPSQRAALAALAGIFAHLIGDSFPAGNFALLTSLYVAYVCKDTRLDFPKIVHKGLTWAAVLAVVAWSYTMLQYDRAQYVYERGLFSGRYYDVYEATKLDPQMRLYGLELSRLDGAEVVKGSANDLSLYGLTMYGRVFK